MNIQLARLSRLLFCLTFVTLFFSCKKDSIEEVKKDIETIDHPIVGKWNISAKESPYSSFEFSEDGNYIVAIKSEDGGGKINTNSGIKSTLFSAYGENSVQGAKSNTSPIHFGTYKIEGNKIILSGFGVIDVISVTDEEFNFSFTLQSSGNGYSFVANKSDQAISSSSKTDILCRTWIVESVELNREYFESNAELYEEMYGADWFEVMTELQNETLNGTVVLFSKAGTYLTLQNGAEDMAGLAEWKWTNSSENAIYYSWGNWQDYWQENIAEIKELSNSKFVLKDLAFTYNMKLK